MPAALNTLPSISDNYGWVSPQDSHFTPRGGDSQLQYQLTLALLTRDHEFSAFVRNAEQSLYLTVNLGMRNLFMAVYTEQAIQARALRSVSRQAMPMTGVAIHVSRTLVFTHLDPQQAQNLHTAYPTQYFQRRLRPSEIQLLDAETQRIKRARREALASPVPPDLIPA